MGRYWTVLLLATLAAVCRGEEEGEERPALLAELIDGKKFNISIPNAGKAMLEFKYYVSVNTEFKDAKELFCKGRVECFNDKSRFRLVKDLEMKEGDTLNFYLIGYKKPDNFQIERVYEVKKADNGKLEFQQKSEREGLEKEGLWYPELEKLKEVKP